VHLAALRRKLGDPALIETVYGHGFRLADRETVAAADAAAGGSQAWPSGGAGDRA
jgi:DNA-binding winged helix-turn-helix (wHTH) protein